MDFLSGIDLYESGCRIISTLADGVMAKATALVDSVKGIFADIREYLPFSDAKKGPLSDLTASGGAIMTTLGAGVTANKGSLVNSVSGALAGAGERLSRGWDQLAPKALSLAAPVLSMATGGGLVIPAPVIPEAPPGFAKGEGKSRGQRDRGGKSISIHIANLSLPDVADAKGFVAALQGLVAEYDGV